MKARYWIQNADYSFEELGEAHQLVVIELLRSPSWIGDFEYVEGHHLVERKQNSCLPGLGIVGENGDVLHFCPDGDDEWMVNYQYDEKQMILGVFPSTKRCSETVMEVITERAEEMVCEFFSGDRVNLV